MSNQTYGERAVRLPVAPVHNSLNYSIRKLYADILDVLDHERLNATTPEAKRAYSVAITETEAAQMWAIKALTSENT